tara:strand:+ start:182 stop:664 length:483 start_codon:yes stop_codon:yes gene_type:complete
MINIVLYNPQIPPNTGNIMRLCSNTGFSLHIIEPLGFPLDDKSLKRAKLDYFSAINPVIYKSYKSFINKIDEKKIYAVTKYGKRVYSDIRFAHDIFLLFGSETSGLPKEVLSQLENRSLKIPMIHDSRSLNLSNSVAIVAYEVWRQLKFSSAYLSDNIYI